MNKYVLLVLAGILLGGCASYTATSGRVVIKDDSAEKSVRPSAGERTVEAVRFSAGDRTAIADYYRKSPANSAAGSMPVLRGGWLTADARTEPLPSALERKLSPIPASHSRQKVGRDVVLIERKSRQIADVIYDVTK